uniref:EamA domain-containing protein n=1 Tax=Tetraselmis chuii TaxID=63592 RepID=A0A7S1SPQ5_9CHLO
MGRQPEAGARPLLGQRPRPVSDNDVKEEEEKQKGRNMGVYGALVFTQVALSFGAAYLRISLQATEQPLEPVIFAMCREMLASPPLLAFSWYHTGVVVPPVSEAAGFMLLGFCLFLNQLFFLMGLQLSGVVVATCMQPSVPVFTVGMAVLVFRTEVGSMRKLSGIFMAVVGAVLMVFGSSSNATVARGETTFYGLSGKMLLGNLCLMTNCLCASLFFINAKRLTTRHHAASVTAWAYCAASFCMLVTAMVTVPLERWSIPVHAWAPLAYWVVVCSVIGYFCLTWATSRVPASHVAASQCLQPFVGTLMGYMLLGEHITWWDLGSVAILAGLATVVTDQTVAKDVSKLDAKGEDGCVMEVGSQAGDELVFIQRRMSAASSSSLSRVSSTRGATELILSPPPPRAHAEMVLSSKANSETNLARL